MGPAAGHAEHDLARQPGFGAGEPEVIPAPEKLASVGRKLHRCLTGAEALFVQVGDGRHRRGIGEVGGGHFGSP